MTSVDAFGFYADWRCVGYPWTTGLSHCCRRRGSCADTARSLILLVTVCRQQSATDRGSGEENCPKGLTIDVDSQQLRWVHPTLWAWPGLDRPGSSKVQSTSCHLICILKYRVAPKAWASSAMDHFGSCTYPDSELVAISMRKSSAYETSLQFNRCLLWFRSYSWLGSLESTAFFSTKRLAMGGVAND